MDVLSDEYGRRALDFVKDMQKLTDAESVKRRILAELEWFGFTHVTVVDMPKPGEDPRNGLLLNTRPDDYNEHYARENLVAKDPVVLALRDRITPFTWNDVRAQKISRSAARIIDEGRDFGARDGFVIPIVTASGSMSIFSPCGHEPNLSPRARAALDMIGIYAHQALQKAAVRTSRKDKSPDPLTSREREIITWIAAGKTDDEIATILSIGQATVTTHTKNAMQKLGATRRAQAVMQAVRFGEISL